jgi:uncharacterized membrane protein YoaT (DUF817 family)
VKFSAAFTKALVNFTKALVNFTNYLVISWATLTKYLVKMSVITNCLVKLTHGRQQNVCEIMLLFDQLLISLNIWLRMNKGNFLSAVFYQSISLSHHQTNAGRLQP